MPLILSLLAAAPAMADCGAPADPIHQIQGRGEAPPMTGRQVTVEGILTLDARGDGGFRGFYLQQPDAQTDSDARTSEALFVYTPRKTGQPGDRLRVTGTVKEFHGLTELVDISAIDVCGSSTLPEAIPVTLPWSQPPESLENMRVTFTQPLTVIEHYQLAVFGELALAPNDQIIPTEYLPPGRAAVAQNQMARRRCR
ncbi:MAG: hypothetical protein B7X58_14870 [Marinobacter sp. 34-60-7]|nr:MAG: hypothetical protein B7X58_14870 [Marinobacter sp. 34-60-7]